MVRLFFLFLLLSFNELGIYGFRAAPLSLSQDQHHRHIQQQQQQSSPPSLIILHSTAVDMISSFAIPSIMLIGASWAGVNWFQENNQSKEQAELWAQAEARYQERARLAYIAPRNDEPWTLEELKQYDGTLQDETGPILIGVAGKVYNVWKGRNFYGPGGEYHVMAGTDATRMLAKFQLTKDEGEDDDKKPLTVAEKACLEGYIWIFRDKYEVVGVLQDGEGNQ